MIGLFLKSSSDCVLLKKELLVVTRSFTSFVWIDFRIFWFSRLFSEKRLMLLREGCEDTRNIEGFLCFRPFVILGIFGLSEVTP